MLEVIIFMIICAQDIFLGCLFAIVMLSIHFFS
jgi:hypothetical protein